MLATAGMTMGRTGITLRNPNRAGRRLLAKASTVPSTIAITREPRASWMVVRMTWPMEGLPYCDL